MDVHIFKRMVHLLNWIYVMTRYNSHIDKDIAQYFAVWVVSLLGQSKLLKRS